MRRSSILRTAGFILLGDQISRHRRNLFSRQALKRFAALGYLSGVPASIELVQLLRDFVTWEPNTILRRRAAQILARMERQLGEQTGSTVPTGIAG
jgi:predicted component of type VI protein secretion system